MRYNTRGNILVIRFSSMGDAAIINPVIKAFSNKYDSKITILSKPSFEPLFRNIHNVNFFGADLYNKHKGILGLITLFQYFKTKNITHVADLHGSIRSRLITSLFKFTRIKTAVIDKGRKDKAALVRRKNKIMKPLKPTFYRYAQVFEKLGFPFDFETKLPLRNPLPLSEDIINISGSKNRFWLGIAPFARHIGKTYPFPLMRNVLEALSNHNNITIFILGGYQDIENARILTEGLNNIKIIAGKFSLHKEIKLISNLDLMLCMDSANMHLASMQGIKTISVWGATHPYAGFMGFGQDIKDSIQSDISCRPCSIYGNKPCFRKDYACMHMIDPDIIIRKVFSCTRNTNKIR